MVKDKNVVGDVRESFVGRPWRTYRLSRQVNRGSVRVADAFENNLQFVGQVWLGGYPGEGRYLISRVPFEGAVEGTVKNGQIGFTLDGQDYLLLSAAPILSAEHAWVSHDPQYKLSEHLEGASDGRPWFRVRSLKVLLQPQLGNID